MKRHYLLLLCVLALLFLFSLSVGAQQGDEEIDVLIIFDQENPQQPQADGIRQASSTQQALKTQQIDELKHDLKQEGKLTSEYETKPAAHAKLTQKEINELKKNQNIKEIKLVRTLSTQLSESIPLINAHLATNITVQGTNINGSGQTVCVLDSGIDLTHHAFTGRIVAQHCYCSLSGGCCPDGTSEDTNATDDNGHGTHVAGIVASSNSTYRGVAPGANIAAIKVCNSAGSCNDADIGFAIDWCIQNKDVYNISVITASVGSTTVYTPATCPTTLDTQITNATNNNIFVDFSSGNSGSTSGLSYPSCSPDAVSVGAVYDADVGSAGWGGAASCTDSTTAADKVGCFSNAYTNLDILAPGAMTVAAKNGGGFESRGGTSMAAPHVAGNALLLKQYWKLAYNLNITPAQILTKLQQTGVSVNDTRDSSFYKRINVLASLAPFINYTTQSAQNNTNVTTSDLNITVDTDVAITHAFLEITSANATKTNYSMALVNATRATTNLISLLNATYAYKVYANDTAGTFGVSAQRTLTLSSAPIAITITQPQNNSYKESDFNLNATFSAFLLKTINYSITNGSHTLQSAQLTNINRANYTLNATIDASNSTFQEGNHTITLFANDSLANNLTKSITIFIDKTAPLLFAFNRSPATVYSNDTVNFTLNITDAFLNTSALFFSSNYTGTWTNYTLTNTNADAYSHSLTNLTSGAAIYYQFFASDLAGNTNQSAQFNFTVQNRAPQNVSITNPANASVLEVGEEQTFSASANDPEDDTLTFNWQFTLPSTTKTGQNVTHTFTSTGTANITLTANDSQLTAQQNFTYTINDTKAPTSQSLTYQNELHIESEGKNQTFNLTLFDYSGISNATLTYNDSLESRSCSLQNATTWICSWQLLNLSVGSYNVTINATDNFQTKHTNTTTYAFSVTSCSDGSENGDEAGTDCGGSCASSCSSGSSSSSGGGGGGGGGGISLSTASEEEQEDESSSSASSGSSSSQETSEQETQDQVQPTALPTISLQEEKQGSITFTKEQSATVRELKIDAKVLGKTVGINLETATTLPANTTEPQASAYQYLIISLEGLENKQLKYAQLTFSLPLSELESRNLTQEDARVRLELFENAKWRKLPTQLVNQTQTELFYQARVPHFSTFAITIDEKPPSVLKRLTSLFNFKELEAQQIVLLIIILLITACIALYFIFLREPQD